MKGLAPKSSCERFGRPSTQNQSRAEQVARFFHTPSIYPQLARVLLIIVLTGGAVVALSWLFTSQLHAATRPDGLAAQGLPLTTGEQIADDWTKRIKLTFTNTAQSEALLGFPVLVVLDSSRIDYALTRDSGEDLRFLDADGVTVLPHEIERWDESGTSYVWVRIPRIEAACNTDYIWLYYGNPNAEDGQDPASVFTDTYRMVYHLDEDPATTGGVISDSTANEFHGANRGSLNAAGMIANAQEFDGSGQYVDLGTDLPVLNSVAEATLSAWIKPYSVDRDGDILGLSRHSGGSSMANSRASIVQRQANLHVTARSRNDDNDFHDIPTTSDPLSASRWHYAVGVINYSQDSVAIYIDGVTQPTTGTIDFTNLVTPDTNSSNSAIGSNDNGTNPYFDGGIDEVRVAAVARSADWIAAQYLSMTDDFIAYGIPEEANLPLLSLDVSASRDEVFAGSRLDYSLLVSNRGGSARQLVVSDVLPAYLTYGGCTCNYSGTPPIVGPLAPVTAGCGASFVCSLEDDKVVWQVDQVDGDRLLQLTFWATVESGLSDGTTILNDSYTLVADRLSPLMVNQPVTTTVRQLDVSLAGQAQPNPVTFGETLQFTLTLRNDGAQINDVTVTDTLPSGVSYVSCAGALCERDTNHAEVRWWLPGLAANSEQQLALRVVVDGQLSGMILNEHYGAWIPEAGQSVMGQPIEVAIFGPPMWLHRINIPVVFLGVTR
jgi:uncharacterized repeat protein (TIGR01451 family)